MLDILNLPLLLAQEAPYGGIEGPDYTRYLIVCATVLLAVFGGAFGFRRLMGESLRRRAAARSLRVVDVLPIGPKQRLTVVQCYDRTFVLGQGEKEVQLVAELDPVTIEAPESPAPGPRAEADVPHSFRALLEGTQNKIQSARVGGSKASRRKAGALPSIEELA